MGGIFYLAGVVLAGYFGYFGYVGFAWYFLFIAAFVMVVGYLIIRAPQIHGIVSEKGVLSIPSLLLIQMIPYSIVTAVVYFIASFVS